MRFFTVEAPFFVKNARASGVLPPASSLRLGGGKWRLTLLALAFGICVSQALAQNDDVFPPKPEFAVYVHDYSGWLSAAERAALEQKLSRYTDSTSTQIVVMIRPDLGGYDKSSYAFELGNRWGVGRKDKNNGVVMLIKSEPPDRGIFIATGYGTEGALPDITAGQIIRNVMAPFFRQQQYYAGIDAGLDAIIQALAGEFKIESGGKKPSHAWIYIVIILLVITVFLILVIRASRSGTFYSGMGPISRHGRSGWGGGFGGGFGGWSGGGGGFGGGGGSSFGGGSFGGGGAGGDW